MYVAIYTQSNIIFIIDCLSQYLSNSAKYYNYNFKYLICYVQSIINLNIEYESSKNTLIKYSNSNYVADIQKRKFILEYTYMFNENFIL